MIRFFAFILSFILVSTSVNAEQKSAMSYTTIGARKTQDEPKHLRIKTIKSLQNAATSQGHDENEDVLREVWEQYRKMAATPPPQDAIQEDTLEEKAVEPMQAATPAGMAGILQTYRANKDRAREMRTIEVTKPKKPNVEKPKAPETAE